MALSTTINDLGRRQAYMDWLYSRLIGPHRMSDPELMADLASALRTVIDEMILGQAPPEGQAVADHAVRMLLSALPTPVREQIDADHAFISRFGFEPAITLDGLRLPAEEFWRAVVETVNGRSATITTSSAGAPSHDDHPNEFGRY